MEKCKIPLVIYTHSDCSFIFKALIGQVNKHVKNMDIYFGYNNNAPVKDIDNIPQEWIKLVYDNNMIWTDRVHSILENIKNEYILFIHEDWLPIDNINTEALEIMSEFMKSVNCGFLLGYSHISVTSKQDGIYSGFENYYYYKETAHIFQPAIWKKSTLEEFCKILKKTKNQNEDRDCLNFMSTKNCHSVQNIKTVTTQRTTNSLIFPHMHALSVGLWNFLKYKGIPELGIPTLKELLESYGINTEDKGIHDWWEIDTQ